VQCDGAVCNAWFSWHVERCAWHEKQKSHGVRDPVALGVSLPEAGFHPASGLAAIKKTATGSGAPVAEKSQLKLNFNQ